MLLCTQSSSCCRVPSSFEICDVSTGLPCRKPLGSKVVMSTLDCDTSCHTSQHVSPRDWIFSVAGALPQPFVGGCCCHGEWPLHWNVAFTGWLVWHCQGCPSGDVQVSLCNGTRRMTSISMWSRQGTGQHNRRACRYLLAVAPVRSCAHNMGATAVCRRLCSGN